MRALFAGLTMLALAACGAPEMAERAPVEGYTLEVRAASDAQVFLVTAPDGRTAAARTAGGVSSLMDVEAARAFTVLPAKENTPPEVLAVRLPNFELSIAAEGDAAGEDGARVMINAGGRQIDINARDDGSAEAGRAHVRITGASAEEARDFVADAEELSPEVQAEMLAALGLS